MVAALVIGLTPWHGSMVQRVFYAIGLGLCFALYPVTLLRGNALVFLIPLGIVAAVECIIWIAFMWIMGLAVGLALPALAVGIGYLVADIPGAVVGVLVAVAILIAAGGTLRDVASSVMNAIYDLGDRISSWVFPWPGRLMSAIWRSVTRVGLMLGGDIRYEPMHPIYSAFLGAALSIGGSIVFSLVMDLRPLDPKLLFELVGASLILLSFLPRIAYDPKKHQEQESKTSYIYVDHSTSQCIGGEEHDWEYIKIPTPENQYQGIRKCERCERYQKWLGSSWA